MSVTRFVSTRWILGRLQILTVSGEAVAVGGPSYSIVLGISKDIAQAQYDAKSSGHCCLDCEFWRSELAKSCSRHYSQFVRRYNPNSTIDSICTGCYLTVATADTEKDLGPKEPDHRCSETVGDLLPCVDKSSRLK